MEIRKKVALVTGAGAGIGLAVARRFAQEGAAVVVADTNEDFGLSAVRAMESAGGRAAFVRVDVASETDASRMVTFAEDWFGGLDVLVNNAGGVTEPYFAEGEPEHWGSAIDLNLRGVMLGIHFGVRAMKKRGAARSSTSRPWEVSVSNLTIHPSTARPKRGWWGSPPHWPPLRREWVFA